MKDQNKLIMFAIGCITMIICGILFWPTLYRYDKLEGNPVKINRITGYTERLSRYLGWVPVKGQNAEAIPQDERNKIEIRGYFDVDEYDKRELFRAVIYNGTSLTIKKIRLSIGGKNSSGNILWQKTYETAIDIKPFYKDSFSIKVMDGITDFDKLIKQIKEKKITNGSDNLTPEVEIKEVYGYKNK